MKIVTHDGLTVEGTPEKIASLVKKGLVVLNSDKYYLSEKNGVMLISDMNEYHLKNALLKIYRQWVAELSNLSGEELLVSLQSGPDEIIPLLRQYAKLVR